MQALCGLSVRKKGNYLTRGIYYGISDFDHSEKSYIVLNYYKRASK